MTVSSKKECPDCGSQLVPIRVLQRRRGVLVWDQQCALEWASGESTRSILSEKYKVEGTITALRCRSCGRVLLYAEYSQ